MSKQIPLTQGQVALVDDDDFDWLSQWKWHAVCFRGAYYAARATRKNEAGSPITVYMHRVIAGTDTGQATHHLNKNGLDNRRDNVRVCTPKEHKEYHYPESVGARKTFSLRLTGKQNRKLTQLALLSNRTKQSILCILIENANLNDVTRLLIEDVRLWECEPA